MDFCLVTPERAISYLSACSWNIHEAQMYGMKSLLGWADAGHVFTTTSSPSGEDDDTDPQVQAASFEGLGEYNRKPAAQPRRVGASPTDRKCLISTFLVSAARSSKIEQV